MRGLTPFTINYGSDTVQFSETIPAYDAITPETGDEPVWKTTSKVWQDGETSPTGGTIVSTTLRSADGLRTSTRSVEFGKPSYQTTTLQGNRSWKITATAPDGTKQVRQYTAGLLASSTSLRTDNSPLFGHSFSYDAYNRPISQTDFRTGLSQIRYRSTTADVVSGVTEPGNRITSYAHDVRNRRTATTLPDNTISNTTYTPRGEVESQSGSQTYPTSYTYDYAGRMKTMTTSGTAGNVITAWNYSHTKGEVVSKRYDSNLTGTTGTGPSYSYTAAGRLNTRTWASGKHTRYDYDSGGRLVHTRYFTTAASDTGANAGNDPTTPDISATHDALGRIKDVTRNGALHAQYSYRTSDLKFLSERQQADALDQTLTYTFEDGQNNTLAGRNNGHSSPAGTTTYSYGAADGRLASVSGGGLHPPSPFHYTYLPASKLVETVIGSAHTVTNTWEPDRDVLATKINATTAGAVSSFRYSVNSIGQREAVSPVLDENDDPVSTYTPAWDWSYNPRGELTEAEDKNGTAHRAYEYDSIGNRTKAIEALAASLAAAPANYVANAFNQYFQIKNPQSTIVNPVHDSDGNLQLDGGINKDSQAREYIWDGENRLIAVKRSDTNATLVTYQYDHHSRLIARSTAGITTRYLYEGWNRIAEYRQTGSGHDLEKSYLWGMDMSGSIQGAGGVGGLLMVSEISNSQISNYHPAYDGNGNITEYLDANGNPVAHYEYDPFGKITVATGVQANNFAHRFSTKPLDELTGWYYYGYRWYDPLTGRWPSRDPIEEMGGVNLYGFVGNSGVNEVDVLGFGKGKVVGWVVKRVSGKAGLTIVKPLYSVKAAQSAFKTGRDILVKDGTQAAKKIAQSIIEKSRLLHHKGGHEIFDEAGNLIGRGLPHFQDDLISGKHIFYTLGLIAATHASAGECEGEISVDEIYTDPYPGKSVANYLTVTQYAGEDSWASLIDWVNPLELIAIGGDIGRDYSRESEKELIGYSISVTIEDKALSIFVESDGTVTGASLDGLDVMQAENIDASVEYILQTLGK